MAKKPQMRRKKYTPGGISRVACCRCGAPSQYQWQCCATGNLWMGLCADCDIGLNRAALEYIGHPDTERLIAEYARLVKGETPPEDQSGGVQCPPAR